MKFIRLTDLDNPTEGIILNIDNIKSIDDNNGYRTIVNLQDDIYNVKETIEDIHQMLIAKGY